MAQTMSSSSEARPQTQTRVVPRRKVQWTAYLYILPAFLIIGAFHIVPVFYAIYVSLNKGPINRFVFVGLDNYARILGGKDFWNALIVTFSYALMTMPFTIALGLFFAYLLYQGVKGRGVYRVIFFLPYVISTVGSAIIWAWVFDPQSGLANFLLKRIGLAPLRWLVEPSGIFEIMAKNAGMTIPSWAYGPSVALVAISIFSIWQQMGYDVIIFLAGLTNIPGEMYEAARIDGANPCAALFRYITVPLLAPTTFFVVVISIIGSLQSFNHIFTMNRAATQALGGPLGHDQYADGVHVRPALHLFELWRGLGDRHSALVHHSGAHAVQLSSTSRVAPRESDGREMERE